MKIRTITTGINLKLPLQEEQFKKVAEFTIRAKTEFQKRGYVVQTRRTSTQPWEQYFKSKKQIVSLAKELERVHKKYRIDFFNIGTTKNPKNVSIIYDILKNTTIGFCTVTISDEKTLNFEAAKQTAKLIKKISKVDPDGFTNLRFAALFNTKAGSPFYPAAYHSGPTSFAIGTENSDLVYKAFSKAQDIQKASSILKKILTDEYKRIESIAKKISKKEKIKYDGIDVSIATSVNPDESIAYAFEKLGLGKFGEVGTLAIAKIVTDVVKNLDVKKCGYSGLMLPVLEDYGLAMRNKEGTFNLTNLLLYSAVCGTGLDTIPLPGNVSEKKLYALLLDIASLSIKLNKPLSARLMPVPNKKIGDMTKYKFEYFANSKTMKI
ncbi:DUF711 family protein [Patescibacteria group bacterium AH-259-L07]|nr:DUF711 family protein [Patescibacteria group bacterium AH-259-L07]